MRPSIWSLVRIDQTCLGRSGGFAPVSFLLVPRHGSNGIYPILHVILLGLVTEPISMGDQITYRNQVGSRTKADFATGKATKELRRLT
jgi:hypothetical protein